MASIPSWPPDLHLSLNANNWLEWSQHLIMSLKMSQLDKYPLGLLKCPDHQTDRTGHRNWWGNDQMILGYMWSHMYSSQTQCITDCLMSARAYNTLYQHHEKQSGLMQIQLIQQMMQVHFDNSPTNFNTTTVCPNFMISYIELRKLARSTSQDLLFFSLPWWTFKPHTCPCMKHLLWH